MYVCIYMYVSMSVRGQKPEKGVELLYGGVRGICRICAMWVGAGMWTLFPRIV